jgi:hypothetical protein
MPVELIPHTKRRKMTRARAAKIFLARNGICFNCRRQINQQTERWFIEHPDSLAQGGSDDDEHLWPSHYDCKPEKDAADAKAKAKRDRLVTANYMPDGVPKRPAFQSRGFEPAPPQRKASTPPRPKFPGDVMSRKFNAPQVKEVLGNE